MNGFRIITASGEIIRFRYYDEAAPATVDAFAKKLPFTRNLLHARISGQEIWTDDAPELDIIQENGSVFTEPGEVVIAPLKPARAKTSKCLGIYYGEGKGLDSCNIFAKVLQEDFHLLKNLGEEIWRQGEQTVTFENPD